MVMELRDVFLFYYGSTATTRQEDWRCGFNQRRYHEPSPAIFSAIRFHPFRFGNEGIPKALACIAESAVATMVFTIVHPVHVPDNRRIANFFYLGSDSCLRQA